MARPRHEQPTPAELEILKLLWARIGPASVRDVLKLVNQDAETPRAYTSVMSLLNVMTDSAARAERRTLARFCTSLFLRESTRSARCWMKRSSGSMTARQVCWWPTCSTSLILR